MNSTAALWKEKTNRCNHRGHKEILWGLLSSSLDELCKSQTFRRLTCRSSRKVFQGGSLHHGVGVSHHEDLVEHRVVVDEALDYTRRGHVLQVLFAEDDGHLWMGGTVDKEQKTLGFASQSLFITYFRAVSVMERRQAWQRYWFPLIQRDIRKSPLSVCAVLSLMIILWQGQCFCALW